MFHIAVVRQVGSAESEGVYGWVSYYMRGVQVANHRASVFIENWVYIASFFHAQLYRHALF